MNFCNYKYSTLKMNNIINTIITKIKIKFTNKKNTLDIPLTPPLNKENIEYIEYIKEFDVKIKKYEYYF